MEPINSRWWRSSSGSTEEPPPIKRCGDEDGGFERLQVFGLTVWWIHPGDSSSAEQPHSVLSAFFKRWQILDILCKKPQSSLQHWQPEVCVSGGVSPLCGFVFQQGPSLRLVWLHLFGCLRVTQTLTDSKLYYVQQRPVRHTQDVFT